ncbi:uncharacterized protein Rnf146 isoform X4 [Drosophila pseudoobscura]|uniref:E3 ubiquitin-protein ligase n=1 Tax=Drosophila pseudoobscura pseudoobscura TaxID=46245 RepID=A0A0R3P7B0_DROPS|nr:uncharacterized protein LOC6900270 isoform X4 [Drosophila pseudoobscura]
MSNYNEDINNEVIVISSDEEEELVYLETIDLTRDMPSTSAAAAARDANGIVGAARQTGPSPVATATNGETGPPGFDGASGTESAPLECAVCLQTCIHPARLPCGHIFCFLCIKGVAYKNRRCAMCRREIPAEFLDNPTLVNGIEDIWATRATEDGYQWYYEGRNEVWWAYDRRTNEDIEEGFEKYETYKKDNPQEEVPSPPSPLQSLEPGRHGNGWRRVNISNDPDEIEHLYVSGGGGEPQSSAASENRHPSRLMVGGNTITAPARTLRRPSRRAKNPAPYSWPAMFTWSIWSS